jgi:hypothetical protein
MHLFYDPVSPEEVPDYHNVIHSPMDFVTMRKKIAANEYSNYVLFKVE